LRLVGGIILDEEPGLVVTLDPRDKPDASCFLWLAEEAARAAVLKRRPALAQYAGHCQGVPLGNPVLRGELAFHCGVNAEAGTISRPGAG